MRIIKIRATMALLALACTPSGQDSSCVVLASAQVAPTTVCGRPGLVAGPFDNSTVFIPGTPHAGTIQVIETWTSDTIPFTMEAPEKDVAALRQTLDEASRLLRAQSVNLRPRQPSDPDYLVISLSASTTTHLGRAGGAQDFLVAHDASSEVVARALLNAAGLPLERLAGSDLPRQRPTATEVLALRHAFGLSLAQAAHGLDRDAPSARQFLNAIPADLKLPCEGPAPAVEYCAALDKHGPSMRDVGHAVERAFHRLLGRPATADEMIVMLDRYEIGLSWAEQQRMIALLEPGEVKIAVPIEIQPLAIGCPIFNAKFYLATNPDLKALGIATEAEALRHWLSRGIWEGRRASSAFHLSEYWNRNNAALVAGYDSMLGGIHHFVTFALRDPVTVAEVNALCETRTTP